MFFSKFLKEYVSIDGALNLTQNSTAASKAVRVLAKDTLSGILFYGWMILPFVSIYIWPRLGLTAWR